MKIVLLDALTLGDLKEINDFSQFGELTVFRFTKPDETIDRIENADIVITNKVVIDKNVMDKSPSLKLICVAATGTNNIDLEYAEKKNILVKNVKGYSTDSVAQHTFSLMLHILNHVDYYDQYVKSKGYSNSGIFTHHAKPVYELKGMKLGIIGLGAIGERVAEIASVFGMQIIYYSTSGFNSNSKYKKVSLEQLLVESDIISIHAPLNEKTKNLISYKDLKQMKSSSIILNTGRGGIINERDLAKALDENLIRAAALDVFEKEPISAENPLLMIRDKEKLLLTPHIAWASVEARQELVKGISNNINSFIQASVKV